MNPGPIRQAIVDALEARPVWEGVDLFRYPPGDRAGRNGFALGNLTTGANEDLDLSGATHAATYRIEALLWLSGSGATDDAYAEVETKAHTLLDDLVEWLRDSKHGKGLGVDTLDYLELASWDLSFTPEPAAVVEVGFDVSEYV